MKQPKDDSPNVPASTSSGHPDTGRRRFMIASVVAAPLLVTLTARPARAQVNGSLGNYGSANPGVGGGGVGRGGGRGRGGF